MAATPQIFELQTHVGSQYAVVCEDPKDDWFQGASNLCLETLDLDDLKTGVEMQDGNVSEPAEVPQDLYRALVTLDNREASPWGGWDCPEKHRIFKVASVKTGRFSGLRAVGIGY